MARYSGFSLYILILFVGLASSQLVKAYDPLSERLPDLAVYPGAKWNWVGQHMAIDDLPASVKMFETEATIDEVVHFYQSAWKTEGNGQLTDKTLGNTRIVGFEYDGYYRTVQLQLEGGRLKGRIVVSLSPMNKRPVTKTRIPVPRGAKILSRIESLDGNQRSESLTLMDKQTASSIKNYYQNELGSRGWRSIHETGGQGSVLMDFQSPEGQLQIIIKSLPLNNGKGTEILVHWLK